MPAAPASIYGRREVSADDCEHQKEAANKLRFTNRDTYEAKRA